MSSRSSGAGVPPVLRSQAWLGGDDEVALLHRAALKVSATDAGRPVIGIADTTSSLNPCHGGFVALLADVERGIRDAGAIPARFPVMSLGEDLMKPSAMLYRNLLAIELEEHARSYPLDGLICLVNCDKTVPAALMASASIDIPSLLQFGGAQVAPMFAGRRLGSGTDLWRLLDERRAEQLDDAGWREAEECLRCAGPGSCNTMGTASTMALMTEALGLCLPGSTGCSAAEPALSELAYATGRAIVEQVLAESRPQDRLTQAALDNAFRILAAVGGSTNAVVHLAAVAGRLGLDCALERVDRLWRDVPLLADIEPCGNGLIQDFHRSGGLATLAKAMLAADLLDGDAATGAGVTLAALAADAPEPGGVIRPFDDPVLPAPTLAALHGSLAPHGAVIKVAAASPDLLHHTGRAVVLDGYEAMRQTLDDAELDAHPDDVIIVRGCGPVAVPGMPEWAMAPIPRCLARQGVRDMVRVSDGRMSGTSFGTVVLHVAPEAAVGGPLAWVEDGDTITLDLSRRRLDLEIDPAELASRRQRHHPTRAQHLRGWPLHYQQHVLQAPQGCDLDYLTAPTPQARRFVPAVVGRS